MSKIHRRRRVRAAAAVLAVGALLAACADESSTDTTPSSAAPPDADSGVSAEEVLGPISEASGEAVRVGFVSDGAYDAADQTIELSVADAAVEYLNQHQAGIAGRPIELVTCTTQGDVSKGADCANKMVAEDVVAVVVGSSAVLQSVWTPLHASAIPTVFGQATTQEVLGDGENTFVLSDFAAGIVTAPIEAAKAAGVNKVTVVAIDVPAAIATYEGDVPALFEDAGLELDIVRVPPGTADMTANLQGAVSGDAGLVQILGNDTFCISAIQALNTLAFDGPISAIGPCISDATRQAIPGDELEGIVTASAVPVGADNDLDALYRAVVETYGSDIDLSRQAGYTTFTALAGFALALDGLTGDVSPATVIATMKAMPDQLLPGGAGLHYRCNGQAVAGSPAICTRGTLLATLDSTGYPSEYEPTSSEPIG